MQGLQLRDLKQTLHDVPTHNSLLVLLVAQPLTKRPLIFKTSWEKQHISSGQHSMISHDTAQLQILSLTLTSSTANLKWFSSFGNVFSKYLNLGAVLFAVEIFTEQQFRLI